MGQIAIVSRVEKTRLTKREQLVVLEIGYDSIDSASAFVGYISECYGFSKSSVWYNLNRLKEKGIVDFATKEEAGKVLKLTGSGVRDLQALGRAGVRLETLEEERLCSRQQTNDWRNPSGFDYSEGLMFVSQMGR